MRERKSLLEMFSGRKRRERPTSGEDWARFAMALNNSRTWLPPCSVAMLGGS